MATESKKTIYETRDVLVKDERYTEDSRRYPPRDRMSESLDESSRPTTTI